MDIPYLLNYLNHFRQSILLNVFPYHCRATFRRAAKPTWYLKVSTMYWDLVRRVIEKLVNVTQQCLGIKYSPK